MNHASVSTRGTRGVRLAFTAALTVAAIAALGVRALAQGRQGRAAATPSISSKPWGTVGGKSVRLYTLSNGSMKVNITNFGGIIQSIYAPDRTGKLADVTLGFANLKGYETNDATKQPTGGSGTTYFGATVGRYANRIANGKFTLNGTTYHLPINNGPNTLHGGTNSWNKEVWTPTTSTAPGAASLQLTLVSPNLQDGFPGRVVAQVTFSLGTANKLTIQYHATTDKPTVINMTNHSYFNLAGEASGTVYGQKLMINSDKITPTDDTQIPTGKIVSVAGGPFDFRHLTPIGQNINAGVHQLILAHGYDDNWIINGGGSKLTLAAKAQDPASGRTLTAYTTQPGVQVYTANYLVGELRGSSGHLYRQGDGFTLETQHYPNSPNQPNFPTTTLNPGTPFNSTTVFQFSTTR
jgi:aldose 1-epimerase